MNETEAKVSAAVEAGDFSPEQKRYLEGFVAGAQIARAAKGVGGARPALRANQLVRMRRA